MKENFLLESNLAEKLYNECAKNLPVIDYHNHLCIADIKNDRKYNNYTQLCISTDPYKHRLMRIMGIEERYITGNATDFEKFSKWCEIFPYIVGTPVYDWTLMELKFIFGIDEVPNAQCVNNLWGNLNRVLEKMSTKDILSKFNIEYSSPCRSIVEDLSFFDYSSVYAPSLRADDIIGLDTEFVNELAGVSDRDILTLDDFYKCIYQRMKEFHIVGCRFLDISLDDGFIYIGDDNRNSDRFEDMMVGAYIDDNDILSLKCDVIRRLFIYAQMLGWTVELHIGALRDTSTCLRMAVGTAGGYAAMGSEINVSDIVRLLDDVEGVRGSLPKTILFTLNPSFNASLSILSGSFSKDGQTSVVTQGPAWWWCDNKKGIREVFDDMSVYSVIGEFVGMTTDSRSILSFVRHDYFRRIFCSWIAEKVESGEYICDENIIKEIIKKVCYTNARKLIGGSKNGYVL